MAQQLDTGQIHFGSYADMLEMQIANLKVKCDKRLLCIRKYT